MWNNKRGMHAVWIVVIMVVVLIAYFGAIHPMLFGEETIIDRMTEDKEPVDEVDVTGCPDDKMTDLRGRIHDSLTTTSENYFNATVMYKIIGSDEKIKTLSLTSTAGEYDPVEQDIVPCGSEFVVWIRTDQNGIVPTEPMPKRVKADGAVVFFDIEAADIPAAAGDVIQARVYDKDNDGYMWAGNTHFGNMGVAQTSWQSINASGTAGSNEPWINFTSITNGSNTAVGIGGTVKWRIELDMAQDVQFGKNALLAIDYADDTDNEDWLDDSISLSPATDVTSSLSGNDLLAFSAYEVFYDIGMVNENQKDLNFEATASSPSTDTIDRDISFRVIGQADYTSVTDNTMPLENVLARDDGTTRTEVCAASGQLFDVVID